MSFLFADLPPRTSLMTPEQLYLWQRSAIFECECDNLINQHIENNGNPQNRSRVYRRANRRRLDAALDAAIAAHGLRVHNDLVAPLGLPPQRSHRVGDIDMWDNPHMLAVVLDNSYTAAIRNRGLHAPRRNP